MSGTKTSSLHQVVKRRKQPDANQHQDPLIDDNQRIPSATSNTQNPDDQPLASTETTTQQELPSSVEHPTIQPEMNIPLQNQDTTITELQNDLALLQRLSHLHSGQATPAKPEIEKKLNALSITPSEPLKKEDKKTNTWIPLPAPSYPWRSSETSFDLNQRPILISTGQPPSLNDLQLSLTNNQANQTECSSSSEQPKTSSFAHNPKPLRGCILPSSHIERIIVSLLMHGEHMDIADYFLSFLNEYLYRPKPKLSKSPYPPKSSGTTSVSVDEDYVHRILETLLTHNEHKDIQHKLFACYPTNRLPYLRLNGTRKPSLYQPGIPRYDIEFNYIRPDKGCKISFEQADRIISLLTACGQHQDISRLLIHITTPRRFVPTRYEPKGCYHTPRKNQFVHLSVDFTHRIFQTLMEHDKHRDIIQKILFCYSANPVYASKPHIQPTMTSSNPLGLQINSAPFSIQPHHD